MPLKKLYLATIVAVSLSSPLVHANDGASLIKAIGKGDCDEVIKLLSDGVSPDTLFKDYQTKIDMPVIYIGPNKDGCITEALVKKGADINYQVFFENNEKDGLYITPLSSAVMHGMVDQVELLLKLGASPIEKDKFGNNLVEKALQNLKGRSNKYNIEKIKAIVELLKRYQ